MNSEIEEIGGSATRKLAGPGPGMGTWRKRAMNDTMRKSPPQRATLMALLVLAGAMLIGGQVEAEVWQRIDGTALDQVYARANTDLSGYDRVMIDPLSIWHVRSDKLDKDQLQANLAGLRSEFTETIEAALERHGYEIVDAPGSSAIRLHVELIDLKINEPPTAENPFRNRYRFNTARGKITLIAELRDSETDEVLIRVAHLEKELATAAAKITSAWDEVHQAFTSWSTMLSDTLATPPTANVPQVAELGR